MNLGGAEILVIIVIAVMILGPDKLPGALRMFGKTMGEIKKYQDLARGEINKAMESSQIQDNVQATDENQSVEPEEKPTDKPPRSPQSSKETGLEENSIAPILDEDES